LKAVVEKEFPRLNVIAFQELLPDVNVQPVARISQD
jgi:type III secretory pathway component EscV